MSRIILFRHGKPDFPTETKYCIGRTDLPLSEEGRKQVREAAEHWHGETPALLFSSPLQRCRESAEILGEVLGLPVRVLDDLREIDMGLWDGLPWTEIRERYPEAYAARGEKPADAAAPGGESFRRVQERAWRAVSGLVRENPGKSLLLVTHAGIIKSLQCFVMEQDLNTLTGLKLNYGTVLELETAQLPRIPSVAQCEAIFRWRQVREDTWRHSQAVAGKALEMARRINAGAACPGVNEALTLAAGLLHDVCKGEKRHGEAGAAYLNSLNFPELGEAIRDHDDMAPGRPMNEAVLVYLADKLFQGATPCTLEERYEKRLAQFADDPEALAAIRAKLDRANAVYAAYYAKLPKS